MPDTGQTQSYTNTFGEDSDYSCNPHSYTDLGNGVVKDNVTGLMWQQATAPGTYTWQQAIDYCNNLSLGGYDDWHLPMIKELSMIVDSGIPYPGPTINTSYFPNTVAADYWSSTSIAGISDFAWYVYFGFGYANGYLDKTLYCCVRAVRGGQCGPTVITLSSFTAQAKLGQVILEWTTASEIDNAGFNLYRAISENGEYVKINDDLIPAKGSPTQGASYEFIDKKVKLWKKAYYKLEDIDLSGKTTMHGPVNATPRLIYGISNR